MSSITPKPIIAQVVQTWDVPPGMKIALVVDIQSRFWVVESCPAGTHFWTLAQAQMLPQSGRTGAALRMAVSVAHKLQALETVADIAMASEAQGILPLAITQVTTSVASASGICDERASGERTSIELAQAKSEAMTNAAIALEFKAEKARPMTAHSLSNSIARKQGAFNARLPRRQSTERGDRSEGLRPTRQPAARSSRRADAVLARATVR